MFEAFNFEDLWQEAERKARVSTPNYPQSSFVKAHPEAIQDKPLSQSLKQFLVRSGLPEAAAPFLTFQEVGENLPRVFEIYGPLNTWLENDKQRLSQYFVIGMDGAGNPICVDTMNGERIVLLDHEDYFASIQFVNFSIFHLCICLLRYGERYISNATHAEVLEKIKDIDPIALQYKNFWFYEMDDKEWEPDG